LAEGILEAASSQKQPKPLVAVFMAGEIVEDGIERLKRGGIPVFPTGERAAFVLSKMHEYTLRSASAESALEYAAGGEPSSLPFPVEAPILEPEALSFLEEQGFPFPEHRYITEAEQIPEAARNLRFPLVMKVVSPQILHKSDVGGVLLNIQNEQQVRQAFTGMARRFSSQGFRGGMLYQQVMEGLEIIAGIKQDPTFGPVVLVGAGGVLTELVRDSAVRIAPFSGGEAEDMLSELKINRIITGYRGSTALDREALADLLVRLSDLAMSYPAIQELDFNPIFLRQKGLLIGDVRIISD